MFSISIHTSHAGCDLVAHLFVIIIRISIHTSHAGCDSTQIISSSSLSHFNPHIPCGMWHPKYCYLTYDTNFNPHIPCGMWQKMRDKHYHEMTFQSTHPMRDVTPEHAFPVRQDVISIHTSHAGCDLTINLNDVILVSFQSTHPMRDVTCRCGDDFGVPAISIHTSHAGCDRRRESII